MAYLRYSRSGHRGRLFEQEAVRLARVASGRGRKRIAGLAFAVSAPAFLAFSLGVLRQREDAPSSSSAPVLAPTLPPAPPALKPAVLVPETPRTLVRRTLVDRLQPAEALSSALARVGVSAEDVSALVRDLRGTLDVRSLRVGARFSLELLPVSADSFRLQSFAFHTHSPQGVPRVVRAAREPDAPVAPTTPKSLEATAGAHFVVDVTDAAVETRIEGVAGRVQSNLYSAILEAGEDAVLVDKFVDVFAWNIDFYRATQAGDEFRALVEKRYAGEGPERRFLGYGRVIAAEYVNAGTAYRGFAFTSKDDAISGYFEETGESLERTFLKNPMEVARITSSFGMRFHPVLGRNKQHEGIDYGAPIGTPVWSVADGVVVEAKYSKTAGNMVVVQHIQKIETEYFHFSKIAPGIRAGTRVKQKQVIGFVGSTGLSTGPHLHFGMRRVGSAVDPNKQKFPSAKPVPAAYRAEFDSFVAPLLEQLRALERA